MSITFVNIFTIIVRSEDVVNIKIDCIQKREICLMKKILKIATKSRNIP